MSAEDKLEDRQTWLKEKLKLHVDEYTTISNLNVVVASWNVNSKLPGNTAYDSTKIFEWLHMTSDPDIVAIGLQEVEMTAQAMIKQETDSGKDWLVLLEKELQNAKSKYENIVSKQMVGLFLCVFLKTQHKKNLTDLRIQQVAVGAMNKFGNKGGVGCHFQLYENSFCFITAHLAAHQKEIEKRNNNFHDIKQKMDFHSHELYPEKHDYFFWFGDLNYRIDNIEDYAIKKHIKEKNYSELLVYDQLRIEKDASRVFWNFEEPPITFAPTYKFDPGTLTYDTSEKKRTPAYTDRILYKGTCKDTIKVNSYDRYELLISDHLPISANFDVPVKRRIDSRFRETFNKLVKMYNSLVKGEGGSSSSERIQISVSPDKIMFPNVQLDLPIHQTVTISNLSQKEAAHWSFVPYLQMDEICKSWIRIEPYKSGILLANKSIELKITVCVDRIACTELNLTDGNFSETLCVHVDNGSDYYINLVGTFQRSFYCNTLQTLVCHFQPVRYCTLETYEKIYNSNDIVKLPIPKELWRMCDYIYKFGMRDDTLFRNGGNLKEIQMIRERLDTGAKLTEAVFSIHSMTDCLMGFLDNLAEPIIPTKYYKQCIEACSGKQVVDQVLKQVLPPVHWNTFHYIMAFLREVLVNSDANGLTVDLLAFGFVERIIPSPQNLNEDQKQLDQNGKIQLLKHYLYEKDNEMNFDDDQFLFLEVT